MKPSQDKERLVNAVEDAEQAFWDSITASYPEVKTGDFSFGMAVSMSENLAKYALVWLETNEETVTQPKVTEIMLHRIEYNYDDSELELTDGDEEHIAYCVTNSISEGKLSTTVAVTTEKCIQSVRGYWKINNCPDA